MALEGHGEAVREPVLDWADRQVARALHLAVAEASIGPAGSWPAPDVAAFLGSALRAQTSRHQGLALSAMSVLGAPAARGVIRRCLRSTDADVRAQAIEALDSVGDRRLGASIARLVEFTPGHISPDRDATVRALRDDEDVWIRGLARRMHPDGADMTDVSPSQARIDTMLQLRNVPLFSGLAPEDLDRVAAVAVERWFGPGETLVREGDVGDELFVILEGRVVVTRLEPDGSERFIRIYEAGDHIGELAVLREGVRAATVTADTGSVRTVVIGGEGLTMILRERPDAAMAMLSTLAERITAQ